MAAPTPSPEQLADALEPLTATPPTAAQHLWPSKGVIVGVLVGALAIGALFAALLVRQ